MQTRQPPGVHWFLAHLLSDVEHLPHIRPTPGAPELSVSQGYQDEHHIERYAQGIS